MRTLFATTAMLSLAGCQSTGFLGSGTPCDKAALLHAAFVTTAAVTPAISSDAKRAEKALYAGITSACSTGDLTTVDLVQLVNAYAAAVAEYQGE